jgi:hypothetical protein
MIELTWWDSGRADLLTKQLTKDTQRQTSKEDDLSFFHCIGSPRAVMQRWSSFHISQKRGVRDEGRRSKKLLVQSSGITFIAQRRIVNLSHHVEK